MSETKTETRKINIKEFPVDIPNFNASFEPKDSLIKKWIINWLLSAVKKNQIKENDILPSKSEISDYLGVSIGTVQNAIRYAEDEGYLKSKQKIGTLVSNITNPITALKKSTSKRDKAVLAIKKYIIQKDLILNKHICSARKMAEILNISQNTARLAYEFLKKEGILESRQTRGSESNWILVKYPELSFEEMKQSEVIKADTLVSKITDNVKLYLSKNCTIGEKIPSHDFFAGHFNVSIKTIHDAISKLNKEGILISRRGRYGTILAQNPYNTIPDNIIFANANDASFYSYRKIENKIINYIKSDFKAGDKLPSMKDLSIKFQVSTNTIRKALNSIAEQGYITFSRGKYGGTFIIDVPETLQNQPFKWLSINPDFM